MPALRKSLPVVLALGVLVLALFWLPPLSDGDLVVFDGITFAHHLQRVERLADDTAGIVTLPNHLLHHVLAYALVGPLRALGSEQPGYLAGRLLAGLGGAALVLLVARLAGQGRTGLGAAFALPLVATRAFLLDAGTGETILPAAAAALWSLELACRRPVPWGRLGLALTLALLLRQDNLLALPAVLLTAAWGAPAGRRLAPLLTLAAGVGAATLVLYGAAYALSPSTAGFTTWLLGGGGEGAWAFLAEVERRALSLHLSSFGWALVGRHDALGTPLLAVTLPFVGGVLAAGWLCGGGRWRDPFLGGAALLVAVRALFFAWFDPENWEWHVLTISLVAAAGARLASGATSRPAGASASGAASASVSGLATAGARGATNSSPTHRPSLARQRLGLLLVLAVTAGIVVAHGRQTWALRRSTLRPAVEAALARAGPEADVFVIGLRAAMVLHVHDVPYRRLDAEFKTQLLLPPVVEQDVLAVVSHGLGRAQPTLLVVDRFVHDGMPATRALDARDAVLEGLDLGPEVEVLRWDGVAYAVGIHLLPP